MNDDALARAVAIAKALENRKATNRMNDYTP